MPHSMKLTIFGVISIQLAVRIISDGFVEEVSCSNNHMSVMLNKSDPDIRKWISQPDSQPIAYVYGFKNRTPCGIALKAPGNKIEYNFSVPYGPACSLALVDVEPNFMTAETTIAIEDNTFQDLSKPIRINHVFCLYTSEVQALKISDISNGHQIIASTGGKPKPKVQMVFRNPDGTPLKAAKFGDQVSLYLQLSPDNAYKAISPKHCMFSDKDDMKEIGAKTLTFVQSNCPVSELGEIIKPLQDINEEVYYTQFQAFRFGQQSTVYAHCTVDVCLDPERCEKNCYQRQGFVNGTLQAFEPSPRIRRNSGSISMSQRNESNYEQVAISNQFVVFEKELEQQYKSVETGPSPLPCDSAKVPDSLLAIVGILAGLLVITVVTVVCLCHKLRSQTKSMESAALFSSAGTIQGYDASQFNGGTLGSRFSSSMDQVWPGAQHSIPRVTPHRF